ncbi:MAG TPA: hypothetical protein PK096_02470 [Candidatus Saccharibacteria bacterium]|nr:hypothetical protein [Candidatus Saccharibacteria bacterium]HRK94208.1 hypothetical protein [Candidatus Saccharibacteria bacterium]
MTWSADKPKRAPRIDARLNPLGAAPDEEMMTTPRFINPRALELASIATKPVVGFGIGESEFGPARHREDTPDAEIDTPEDLNWSA